MWYCFNNVLVWYNIRTGCSHPKKIIKVLFGTGPCTLHGPVITDWYMPYHVLIGIWNHVQNNHPRKLLAHNTLTNARGGHASRDCILSGKYCDDPMPLDINPDSIYYWSTCCWFLILLVAVLPCDVSELYFMYHNLTLCIFKVNFSRMLFFPW